MSSSEGRPTDGGTFGPIPLEAFVADSLARLCDIYTSATSLSTDEVLAQVVFPMAEDPRVTGEILIQQAAQAAQDEPDAPHLILAPAVIGLAYHSQCTRSLREGDRDAAWAYMAQCRWWTATAVVVRKSPQLTTQIIAEARKATASQGGRAKAEVLDPVRAEAYRLVREKHARGIRWPSKRQAAFRIAPDVAAFARTLGLSMSKDQITTTLQNWLAEMPDRDELFPKRKKKPAE